MAVLGYVVLREDIIVDQKKVDAILHWEGLKTVTAIQSFLGLAEYYRRFIQDVSRIVTPRTRLTQKEVKFFLSNKCEESFEKMKELLTSAHVLAL